MSKVTADRTLSAPTRRRGRRQLRALVVGGICLLALWSVPVVRLVRGDAARVLELLPELVLGSLSFVLVCLLWRNTLREVGLSEARVDVLRDELDRERDAARRSCAHFDAQVADLKAETDRSIVDRSRAEQANRVKGDLVSTLGHEIRTPLASALDLADTLLDTRLDATQYELTRNLRDRCENARRLVEDILDLSRVESQHFDLADVSFDPRLWVEDALERIAPVAYGRGLELSSLVDPDVPRALRGDPERMHQMIASLLSNAVRFTDAGEVQVRLDVDDHDRVCVSVIDTGIGIAPHAHASIFEPFVQIHRDERPSEGSGLGLMLVKRVAELMGGSVGVQSTPGRGSRFWFTFPLREGQVPPRGRVDRPLAGTRVLVACGSSNARLMLVQRLREWECSPVAAADGPSALSSLRAATGAKDPFRVLLTEASIDDGAGAPLADVVVGDPSYGLPTVLLMARPDDSTARPFTVERGLTPPLVKPIRGERLYERMVEALSSLEAVDRVAPAVQDTVRRVDEAESAPTPARHARILVVDDNPVNRRVASLILARAGYPVDVAEDGQVALDRIDAEPPYDLVLMDVHMPRLDGFAATARIRGRDDAKAKVPILAMTASVMSGDAERCLDAGMDGYISKPVKAETLVAVVESWVPEDAPIPTAEDPDPEPTESPTVTTAIDELPTLETAGIQELMDLADGDVEMLQDLLQSFLQNASGHVETMRRGVTTGDRKAVGDAAHGLRGSSGTLGARRLQDMMRHIEEVARETDDTIEAAWIEEAAKELQAVRVELDRAAGVEL